MPVFRGHLSRPACSHVKQLAKQAGDNSDPGRTPVQAGFLLARSRCWFCEDFFGAGIAMVEVQPMQSETTRSDERGSEADHPHDSAVVRFGPDKPLKLDAGVELSPFQIAYRTYGTLNAERSNAVLVCHALTGDQHVASVNPVTGKPGWWETMVGPGKPIDTERYFVICPNVLGACMGTTGPAATKPQTGEPWGLEFPVITVRDMVRAQAMLLDELGIASLFAVAGGSMGGMQVLQWAASYPNRVFSALPIACATRHSAQNIAFHEVGRQAIMADPEWRRGRYHLDGTFPRRGLAVARMGAHITYLSDAALHRKF